MSSVASALASLITAYFVSAEARGYAASTLASRRLHLAQFLDWCDARGLVSPDELTPGVLERYRQWLSQRRQGDGTATGAPLSWATQANKLTAVRMLLAWAARTKRITVNPAAELEMPRLPKRLPRAVLTVSEMERVLVQSDLTTALGLRDRAILEVLYSTGIRRMELVGLDCPDMDPERRTLFVREGKGKKDRLVPIGERAIRWTLRYLDQVRPVLIERAARSSSLRAVRDTPRRGTRVDTSALFLSARGTRLRAAKLTERLHRYLVRAGIDKPGSVHIFRHTMATLMHDAGADIRDLQEILGHAQLSTTEIYTHVSIERLKAVHARTHPAHLDHTSVHASVDPTSVDPTSDSSPDSSSRARAPAPLFLAAEVAANVAASHDAATERAAASDDVPRDGGDGHAGHDGQE